MVMFIAIQMNVLNASHVTQNGAQNLLSVSLFSNSTILKYYLKKANFLFWPSSIIIHDESIRQELIKSESISAEHQMFISD